MSNADDLDDFDAAVRVGAKVIEMADRVLIAHKILPGSTANWTFTIDDVRFNVVVTVEPDQKGATR